MSLEAAFDPMEILAGNVRAEVGRKSCPDPGNVVPVTDLPPIRKRGTILGTSLR